MITAPALYFWAPALYQECQHEPCCRRLAQAIECGPEQRSPNLEIRHGEEEVGSGQVRRRA